MQVSMTDNDGNEHVMSYARKAMIICGLNKSVNGTWEVKQLRKELQKIVAKYPEQFAGRAEPVDIRRDGESEDGEEA